MASGSSLSSPGLCRSTKETQINTRSDKRNSGETLNVDINLQNSKTHVVDQVQAVKTASPKIVGNTYVK